MHKFTFLALAVLALSGCATTATLKKDDCMTADWSAVGYQDGTQGANAQKILQHSKTCQGISTPNRQAWEEGRQNGLKVYCTKSNAYQMGRMGYTLTGVCEDNLEELHHANMMGLQQYEMSERLDHYRYGYGYPYGYGFFNPWYLFW